MLFKTHIAFTLLISLYIFPYFTTHPIFSILIMTLSSILPDLDTINSKISGINPLRKLTKYIFKHRGMLHSFFTPI
ncbi:metal-dependent hydrolase, partial [Candidatus Woesearchaeota archaeon]|nr:metal-dependent hydrolase [Candidatus Woesearchaeota archaeon]